MLNSGLEICFDEHRCLAYIYKNKLPWRLKAVSGWDGPGIQTAMMTGENTRRRDAQGLAVSAVTRPIAADNQRRKSPRNRDKGNGNHVVDLRNVPKEEEVIQGVLLGQKIDMADMRAAEVDGQDQGQRRNAIGHQAGHGHVTEVGHETGAIGRDQGKGHIELDQGQGQEIGVDLGQGQGIGVDQGQGQGIDVGPGRGHKQGGTSQGQGQGHHRGGHHDDQPQKGGEKMRKISRVSRMIPQLLFQALTECLL